MFQAQARVLFPCAVLLASLWGCPGANTCQEGFASQNGQCVKRCNSPTECAAFETCNDGLCVTAGGGSSGLAGSSSAAGNTSTANSGSSSVLRSSSAGGSGSLGSSNATSTAATSGTATSTLSGSSGGAGSSGGTSVGGTSVGGSSVGGSSGPLPSSSAAVSTQSSSVASSSVGPNSSSVMGASSSAGASSASSSSSGAPAPVLTAVSPNNLLAGCGGTLFTLHGANFATGDVAQLNGQDMATAVVNAATLEVSVPAGYLLTPGTYTFRVRRGAVVTTDAVLTLRPTPASHDFFLHGGYSLSAWSANVFLFNPGNQLASVQVDFLVGGGVQSVPTTVAPSRVVVVPGPGTLDGDFVHVTSPDVAVAGVLWAGYEATGHGASYLVGPQPGALAATAWVTPHVTGGLTTRMRTFNPGASGAAGTARWITNAGSTRTETLVVPPLESASASNTFADIVQWAEVTSDQPVLSHISFGPANQARWDAAPLQVPTTTLTFLAWRDGTQDLDVRVANPGSSAFNVQLRRNNGPGTVFSRNLAGRSVSQDTLSNNQDAPSNAPLLYTVTAEQDVAAGIMLSSGGGNEDDCLITPARAGLDLFLMGGRDSDGWDTRYLLFNPGTQLANYSLEVVGTQATYSMNGGLLPPATGTVFSTLQAGFPGSTDTELVLTVQADQPLYGQVIRFAGSDSVACLTALAP